MFRNSVKTQKRNAAENEMAPWAMGTFEAPGHMASLLCAQGFEGRGHDLTDVSITFKKPAELIYLWLMTKYNMYNLC